MHINLDVMDLNCIRMATATNSSTMLLHYLKWTETTSYYVWVRIMQDCTMAITIGWTGLLNWTTRLDYWTRQLDWITGLGYWTHGKYLEMKNQQNCSHKTWLLSFTINARQSRYAYKYYRWVNAMVYWYCTVLVVGKISKDRKVTNYWPTRLRESGIVWP